MKPFLITVAIFVVLYGPIALLLWMQARRARWHDKVEDSLPLAFGAEDRTADDCPSVALAQYAGGYACELNEGHPLPHRNDVWVWEYDEVYLDHDALAAAESRTAGHLESASAAANRLADALPGFGAALAAIAEPTPTLREESIRCQAKYHYGLDSHYLCDLDLGHPLPHADSRNQVRVRWYGIGADEQVTLW